MHGQQNIKICDAKHKNIKISKRFSWLLFMFILDKLPTIFASSLSNHHLPPRFIRLCLSFRRLKYLHNFVNKANLVHNFS